jgi:hypothetical protein
LLAIAEASVNDIAAIEAVLRAQLPAHLYELASPLATMLLAVQEGRLQRAEAQRLLGVALSDTLASSPSHAVERPLTISIDARSDQITVGDLSLSKSVAAGSGANAQAAEGSNILQVAHGGIGLLIQLPLAQGQSGGSPFMAPDPPRDFVPRRDEFEQIVTLVLSDSPGPVAISAALRGAGGYGKTTLATAVCADQRVRDAFPDGVLWVTLGERPDDASLVGKAADLVERLTGSRPGYTSLEAATSALRETLGERRLLLVVDDVWDAAHLRPFLQGGAQVTRLITTRNRDTLPPGVRPVDVDAMKQGEAVALLAAGLAYTKQQTEALRRVARQLGEWPLLLKIVNGVLRERIDRGKALDVALAYVDEGLREEGVVAFDTASAEGRDRAVGRTLGVSLATLGTEEQQRFAELAVFPEDVAIPLATLERFWRLSPFKVERLCALLFTRSLLLAYDEQSGVVRLHDVVRAYLNHTYLAELPDFHVALLDAHRPGTGHWADMAEDEPYLWQHLASHLEGAGRAAELAATAKDLRYLARKAIAVEVPAVEEDVGRAAAKFPNDEVLRAIVGLLPRHSHLLARCNTSRDADILLLTLCWQQPLLHELCLRERLQDNQQLPRLAPLHALPEYGSAARLRTLQKHTNAVWSGVFSSDGQLVLSASNDGSLILWEVATGRPRHTLQRHSGAVISGVFSPDGQLVLSASDDGSLILWEVATGRPRHTFQGHTDTVTSGVFSPDGQLVLSASNDGSLILWEVVDGVRVNTLYQSYPITCCAFSPDGHTLVAGDSVGRLLFLRVLTRK